MTSHTMADPEPDPGAARATEARRQQALLSAIRQGHQGDRHCRAGPLPSPWPEGAHNTAQAAASNASWQDRALTSYRRHASATACAVLHQTFPTIGAMLGEEALDALAIALWQAHPPLGGDLADWGGALPALLADRPELAPWPWLADCARLDWARHRCERAADQVADTASLARLGDTPPEHLRLVLQDHVTVLRSPWPLTTLWAAHAGLDDAAQQAALAQAREAATTPGEPGHTVVWRQPWRAEVMALDQAEGLWMAALATSSASAPKAKPSLAELLNDAHPALDLGTWLARALGHGWIRYVALDTP
jgi:hypothetical protein